MNKTLGSIYASHHAQRRGRDFVLFVKERGAFFRKYIGTGTYVLDIGCRDGVLTEEYRAGNRVVGIDIDREALARAKTRGIDARWIDLNGSWDALGKETFDAVVAAEVFEHLYYPSEVLAKVHSVLKPGGVLVGSVPNAFSLKNRFRFLFGKKRGTPLEDPTHINHFHIGELRRLLGTQFVSVEIIPFVRHPFSSVASWAPGFIAFSFLFAARKRSQ